MVRGASSAERRYARVAGIPRIGPEGLDSLHSTKVAIVGLGNVGGQLAQHLALLGIQLVLDGIFSELVDEVGLHLLHADLVERFDLKPTKGVLLCGPPGTGKTSLVRALGEYLTRTLGIDIKVLLVPPGIHRSKWFGESEERIRDLFLEAKDAAATPNRYVLLFFDDVDHLGSRDHRIAGEVDARLLPSFLQEFDGLGRYRLLVIGATNREDLLDEALLRPGRFGRIFRTARPDRRQAREIFRRHLTAQVPVRGNGRDGSEEVQEMLEDVLSAIYAPNGEFSALAMLTFRDGSQRLLSAGQVLSGAVIAAAVEQAKRRACQRALKGGPVGIEHTDLHEAVGRELTTIAERLKPGPALNQMAGLSSDQDVVRIELHQRGIDPISQGGSSPLAAMAEEEESNGEIEEAAST